MPVRNYEGLYEASSFGRIYSIPRLDSMGRVQGGLFLSQVISGERSGQGYFTVALHKNGSGKLRQVHRIVADSFIGPIPNGMQVDHIDNNAKNNNISNLHLVTPKENSRRAREIYKVGKPPPIFKGESHPSAKLTNESVILIFKSDRAYGKQRQLARMYGVTPRIVYLIWNKKAWSHITSDL